MRRDDTARPSAARSRTTSAKRSLADGSRPRVGSSSSITAGAVASWIASVSARRWPSERSRGCASGGSVSDELRDERGRGAGLRASVAVALLAFGGYRGQIQQVTGRLGNEAHQPSRFSGRQRLRVAPAHVDIARGAWSRALQRPQQRGLARPVAAHQRHHFTRVQLHVDARARRQRRGTRRPPCAPRGFVVSPKGVLSSW